MTDDAIMSPVHPGEVLQVEYLDLPCLTQHRVAMAINVPSRWINEIVHGKRGITTDTALRLASAGRHRPGLVGPGIETSG